MSFLITGDGTSGGAYVLRMEVKKAVLVQFGRHCEGKKIKIPKGVCVYVGSAKKSWIALGQRLARHLTRSANKPKHAMRDEIVKVFGRDILPKRPKRLRWHIDYLVDRKEVVVTDVIAIQKKGHLEFSIAEWLMANSEIIVDGLGASDAKGHTHLLRVSSDISWWKKLKKMIDQLIRL